MTATLTELKRYCAELGGDPEISPDEAARQRLPMFLAQIYDVARAILFGRASLLFVVKGRENPTPAEIEKHEQLLAKQFGQNIAFVFPSLPAFDRNRLLKRRIPFIVPQRQLFYARDNARSARGPQQPGSTQVAPDLIHAGSVGSPVSHPTASR
jgi:hypothetical protein